MFVGIYSKVNPVAGLPKYKFKFATELTAIAEKQDIKTTLCPFNLNQPPGCTMIQSRWWALESA